MIKVFAAETLDCDGAQEMELCMDPDQRLLSSEIADKMAGLITSYLSAQLEVMGIKPGEMCSLERHFWVDVDTSVNLTRDELQTVRRALENELRRERYGDESIVEIKKLMALHSVVCAKLVEVRDLIGRAKGILTERVNQIFEEKRKEKERADKIESDKP
jgi:hypothetical protein